MDGQMRLEAGETGELSPALWTKKEERLFVTFIVSCLVFAIKIADV